MKHSQEKLMLPWQIKPGMFALVPRFEWQPKNYVPVASVIKGRAIFAGGNCWRVKLTPRTWPTDTILLHGKVRNLPVETWPCLVP